MTYFVRSRWDATEHTPPRLRMSQLLEELDAHDTEHPDVSLTHESGWSLSVYASGLVVLENAEDDEGPFHMEALSRTAALRLWELLAEGSLDALRTDDWIAGYGPPR